MVGQSVRLRSAAKVVRAARARGPPMLRAASLKFGRQLEAEQQLVRGLVELARLLRYARCWLVTYRFKAPAGRPRTRRGPRCRAGLAVSRLLPSCKFRWIRRCAKIYSFSMEDMGKFFIYYHHHQVP